MVLRRERRHDDVMQCGPFHVTYERPSTLLAPGVSVVLHLRADDGLPERLVVGQVRSIGDCSFTFRLLGCGRATIWIDHDDVTGASLRRAHSAHDEREAARRQRRSGYLSGEPWPSPPRESTRLGLPELKAGIDRVEERAGTNRSGTAPPLRKGWGAMNRAARAKMAAARAAESAAEPRRIASDEQERGDATEKAVAG